MTPKLYRKSTSSDLRVPDVYCILCERGKVYVGQMGSATEMRRDEHVRHTSLNKLPSVHSAGKDCSANKNIKIRLHPDILTEIWHSSMLYKYMKQY
jgi:hypothetical protein